MTVEERIASLERMLRQYLAIEQAVTDANSRLTAIHDKAVLSADPADQRMLTLVAEELRQNAEYVALRSERDELVSRREHLRIEMELTRWRLLAQIMGGNSLPIEPLLSSLAVGSQSGH